MSPRNFRRSSIPRSSRPVRPMDWGAKHYHAEHSGGGTQRTAQWIVSPDVIGERFTDPTIMGGRAIVCARLQGTETQVAGLDPDLNFPRGIAFGIIKWPGNPSVEDADLASTAAALPSDLPGPFSNGNADWLWTAYFPTPATTPAGTIWTLDGEHVVFRAKRRMGNNHGLLMVVETVSSSSYSYAYSVRYLIKE